MLLGEHDVIDHPLALFRVAGRHSRRVLSVAVDNVVVSTLQLAENWREFVFPDEFMEPRLDQPIVVHIGVGCNLRPVPGFSRVETVSSHQDLEGSRSWIAAQVTSNNEG